MLTLSLFAHFQARLGGEQLAFPTESSRALLAYLALERERPHTRRHLAGLLWPDSSDEKGLRNLRQTLLRLRQTVPDTAVDTPLILATADSLQWNAAYPAQVDVYDFMTYVAQAAPFLTAEKEFAYPAVAPLQAAAALYQGELLPEFDLINDRYTAWLRPWRQKCRREGVRAFYWLGEAYGRIGQITALADMAQRQLALEPAREEAHAQLIRAHLAQREFTAVVQQYNLCQKLLLAEFNVGTSPDTRSLFETAWQWREGHAPPLPPIPHNLPPEETPFYGRSSELDDLLLRLADPGQRLLTLTGIGGIGKTRLALALARRLVQSLPTIPPLFPDGVWFVPFAEIIEDTEESLAWTIIQACGWEKGEQEVAVTAVMRHLQTRCLLLILDNLEHLEQAANFVLCLQRAASGLSVLATSRRRLGLQREVVQQMQGLPVPMNEQDTAVPSVALFVERMQRIESDFVLDTAVTPVITQLCRFLAGWPLALELTAAWADQIPITEIEQTIAHRMAALYSATPDLPLRQRSIQAVLTGSWALLTSKQQRIFAGFATFRGGCTLEAAQQVLAANTKDMARLVQLALLREQDGRYTIHELIRQFAVELLQTSDYRMAAESAHCDYYLGLPYSLEADLYGLQALTAVTQLRPERENIHQAWMWAVQREGYGRLSPPLRGLIRFYHLSSNLREGLFLFAQAQAALPSGDLFESLGHELSCAQAHIFTRLGEYEEAFALLKAVPPLPAKQAVYVHHLLADVHRAKDERQLSLHHTEQALTLARTIPNRLLEALSLCRLDALLDYGTNHQEEALTIIQTLQDRWLEGSMLNNLGASAMRHGRYSKAHTYWEAALVIALEFDELYTTASLHNNLGDTLRQLGLYEQAEQHFNQSLALYKRVDNHTLMMHPLEGMARLHVHGGQYDEALKLAQEVYRFSVETAVVGLQIAALGCMGHIYAALQAWQKAADCYDQAQLLAHTEWPRLQLEGVAGLACVSLQLGQLAQARCYADQLVTLLTTCKPEGFADPGLIYWRGYEVLRVLGDGRAADILHQGHIWLKEQIVLISTPHEQHLFLENISVHAQLWATAVLPSTSVSTS